MDLLLDGLADAGMMPRKGIFAENFPAHFCGAWTNRCPVLNGYRYDDCQEYKKRKKRDDYFANYRAAKLATGRDMEGRNRRINLTAEQKAEIMAKSHYRCVYCHTPMKQTKCHFDHFIPLAMGGADEPSNIILACQNCNLKKGSMRWELGQMAY
jgi:5-methylcytosine-specific restriction endonuclease McrA